MPGWSKVFISVAIQLHLMAIQGESELASPECGSFGSCDFQIAQMPFPHHVSRDGKRAFHRKTKYETDKNRFKEVGYYCLTAEPWQLGLTRGLPPIFWTVLTT
jgi:hypothetical protein